MASKKTTGLPPGSKAPESGQYQQFGPRGGEGPERTVVKGEPLPPDIAPRDDVHFGRQDQNQVAWQFDSSTHPTAQVGWVALFIVPVYRRWSI